MWNALADSRRGTGKGGKVAKLPLFFYSLASLQGWAGQGGGEGRGGGRKFNFKRHHGSVAVAFGAFVPAAASETVRGGLGNVLSNTFS